jgi:D-mannonate dehydratase
MKLRDDHFDALVERSRDIEHFTLLIEEFIMENITDVRVICDGNLALDVIFEVEDIIDKYSDQIDFEYNRSVEESFDYYEEI